MSINDQVLPPKHQSQKGLVINLNTSISALPPLLIPLLRPNSWANLDGQVAHVLTSLLVFGRLQAQEPLVVPIPAMVGLIRRGETSISRGSTVSLDFVEKFLLLRGEVTQGSGEDFVEFVGVDVGSAHV